VRGCRFAVEPVEDGESVTDELVVRPPNLMATKSKLNSLS